ncbi:MAG: glycosyltransferase family 2 protein [Theionarchaea archaeon]|nr:glycosyltransferase family 2 protein [Theionarchaea archaeon]MBU7000105.1 glycosyltransferase family 2 protein [Theionarchaea archaeon]MBU7033942.1 glycosyltransferase family 2 protein [Theionarchaea archaeon]MBU7039238.1 glycosyltransferase family 2 protein [Theionarchaea archaeon]
MTKRIDSFYQHSTSPVEEVTIQVTCLEDGVVDGGKHVSVIVPLYNEEKNVQSVVEDLEETLIPLGTEYDIILVDDGSTDRTLEIAQAMQSRYHPHVKVLVHDVNKGKTAAMMTGFQHAEGKYVILMDGDGQFRAADIPKMVEKLERGYDVVNGWGKKKEPITKIVPSLIYNGICQRLFSLPVHQFNLGFKAFRREAVRDLYLKKDEHRYILPLLKDKGCTIAEVSVDYLPRLNGKSKYGAMRIPCGIMDMVALKMDLTLGERPFRLFGMISFGMLSVGLLFGLYALYTWLSGAGMLWWNVVLTVAFLLSSVNVLLVGYAVETAKYHR